MGIEICAKCFKTILDYRDDKITKKEAMKRLEEHGDELIAEILQNGFVTHYAKKENKWELSGVGQITSDKAKSDKK